MELLDQLAHAAGAALVSSLPELLAPFRKHSAVTSGLLLLAAILILAAVLLRRWLRAAERGGR
jgi:hypothetical protein